MLPRVTVLATLHVVQGAEKRDGEDDPKNAIIGPRVRDRIEVRTDEQARGTGFRRGIGHA